MERIYREAQACGEFNRMVQGLHENFINMKYKDSNMQSVRQNSTSSSVISLSNSCTFHLCKLTLYMSYIYIHLPLLYMHTELPYKHTTVIYAHRTVIYIHTTVICTQNCNIYIYTHYCHILNHQLLLLTANV